MDEQHKHLPTYVRKFDPHYSEMGDLQVEEDRANLATLAASIDVARMLDSSEDILVVLRPSNEGYRYFIYEEMRNKVAR